MNRPEWRTIAWPNEAPISISVQLAFEAFSKSSTFSTLGRPGQTDRLSLSYGDYGSRVGIWRLLDLLNEEGVKASCLINGKAAQDHPQIIATMAAEGHELVGHGWVNDVPQDEHELGEADNIRRTLDAIATASGGIRPVGWVSPGMMDTIHSKKLLVSENCIYSGDDASDDNPFVEQIDGVPFVTLPNVALSSHDLRQWLKPGANPTLIRDSFCTTFDELYQEARHGRPGSLSITLHAHVAGRPTLLPSIREVIRYAKKVEDVWWARNDEQAKWAQTQKWTRS
jgi:peptidoglycan/xylan/chitin deacetylase (PgdA/CDA1 family)